MSLYEEVKNIYNASEKSMYIAKNLKYTRSLNESKDILTIVETQKEIIPAMRRLSETMSVLHQVKADIHNRKLSIDDVIIHFKTITECEHLEGYRFKKVIFQ